MMKKGKKTVSLIMSLIMLLSCWVWFAPTASAAGGYSVKIEVDVSDHRSTWSAFKTINGQERGYADVTVEYFGENGEEKTKVIDVIGGTGDDVYTFTFNNVSYPKSIFINFGYFPYTGNEIQKGGLGQIKTTVSVKLPGESSYIEIGESITNSGNIGSAGTASFDVTFITTVTIPVNLVWHSVPLKKMFHSGYDFSEDRYSFGNFNPNTINLEYFQRLYGKLKGLIIYGLNNKKSSKGVCYGMAASTAAFLSDAPMVESVIYNGNVCSNLSDISLPAAAEIPSLSMTVRDYVKYHYIYQFSSEESTPKQKNPCLSVKP